MQNPLDEITLKNEQIVEKMLSRVLAPGNFPTAVPGLMFSRREESFKPENCFFDPTITIVLQGQKQTILGSREYRYGEGYCLVNGVYMPSINYPTDASPKRPYLSLSIDVSRYLAIELSAEIAPSPRFDTDVYPNISIEKVNVQVLDAAMRLVELLDKPAQIPVMAPMILREIHYLMLVGPQGGFLRQVNTLGSQSCQIAKAIGWLKENFREPLHVEELAKKVNMGTSTFHRHFKEITSLSPLQYQKRLRLFEAQRLMLTDNEYAANACLAVGYESPTQFNREYKRLFGKPPAQDISRVREMVSLH